MLRMRHSYPWHKPTDTSDARAAHDAWLVTYGDLMSLLLCVFVLLAMMAPPPRLRDERVKTVLASLQSVFGVSKPTAALETKSFVDVLADCSRRGWDEPAGAVLRLSQQADGVHAQLVDDYAFTAADGAVSLSPAGVAALHRLADGLADCEIRLTVIGVYDDDHTTDNRVGVSPTAPAAATMAMTYQRIQTVTDVLTQCGLAMDRLQMIRTDANAPTGRGRAARGVELIIQSTATESSVQQVAAGTVR